MHSNNTCNQPLNTITPSSLKISDKKDISEVLGSAKQFTPAGLVTEEGLLSNSTTNSASQNNSNDASSHGDHDESCHSPSSEKRQELLEESKAEQAELVQSAWGKPLKKVPKQEDTDIKTGTATTKVLKVVKPGPPPKKSALQQFYDNWRGYDRTAPRSKTLYQGPLTILKSNPISSSAQKEEKEALLSQTDVYKHTLLEKEVTEEQLIEETARKLRCSATGVSIYDSNKLNLGYAVYLEKDMFDRIRPVPIMRLLTYNAFFNAPSRYADDSWLPAYINEAHFARNKQYIFETIAILSQQLEGREQIEEFSPLMVLKVLPTLLVKTTIHLTKTNISKNKDCIDTFCQLYRLFAKLVELYPEIKEEINTQIKNFCSNPANRHSKVEEDLGEFLIKLSISSESLQDSHIINLVLQEHLARQALFGLKKEKDLGKGQHECNKFLESYMRAIHVSNQVLLGTIEICRLMCDEGVKDDLEMRYGVLKKETRRVFLSRLSWTRRNIVKDWTMFVGALQQEKYVGDEQVMASYVVKSFETAKVNGYFD